jgi:GT2 family glycosyltransferase
MPPHIGVVVVNWNREADTLRCLAALLVSDYEDFEVVVVDNASTDGSAEAICRAYPALALVRNPENAGFAGGNNVGIGHALERGAEYVFLLNNDAVVEPATLRALAAAAASHPGAGFLGAKVCTLEDRRQVLSAGGRLENGWRPVHLGLGEIDNGRRAAPVEVDFLSGSALLASRGAIEAVGRLDEDFYLYYEDVEWCLRGKRGGFQVLEVPAARVFHPDTRLRDQDSPAVTYYCARNSLLLAKKHRLGYAVLLRLWLTYSRMLFSWSVRPRWRHKRAQREALLQALRDYAAGRFGRREARRPGADAHP